MFDILAACVSKNLPGNRITANIQKSKNLSESLKKFPTVKKAKKPDKMIEADS